MSTATKRQRENHRSNAAGDLCCGQRFNCHLTTFCVRKPGRTSAARFKVHLAPRTTGWLMFVERFVDSMDEIACSAVVPGQ